MGEGGGSSQSQPCADAQERSPDAPHSGGEDVVRDIAGETVCGFKVAAYRETHPEHGDKYGHSYSEHWSTPSRNPAVKVERLFTEGQLRQALRTIPATEPPYCALGDDNCVCWSNWTSCVHWRKGGPAPAESDTGSPAEGRAGNLPPDEPNPSSPSPHQPGGVKR